MLQGDPLRSANLRISTMATSHQTGGAFNLFEIAAPAGLASPLHIHYAEDVAVFVLEGSLAIFWGDEEKQAETGTYSFLPRGTPHGFRVCGETPARVLYLTTPGGFDRFVDEGGLRADGPRAVSAAAHYQIEILGPLPD
jgi:quercetin dioxygenase-like cupin family protein